VVSLPYDAFRPFTSTKTCILLATKRTAAEVEAFREGSTAWERENRGHPEHGGIRTVLDRLGWGEDYIFMAEPPSAGYKRRKGLPDLQVRNDLYQEDSGGAIGDVTPAAPASVLDHFSAGPAGAAPSPTLGFWTTLSQVARRPGLRLDPKYRWLWDFQDGLAHGRRAQSVQLRTFVDLVDLPKVKKGDLAEEERLVDLDSVKPRMGVLREPLPVVDVIGSEKIRFEGCDLAISKLEPYLGKVIRPPQGALGSTEWVGLRIRARLSPVVVQFLLMLPEMCDAYRRLQSGKRHARLIPEEFLDLRVELPGANEMRRLRTTVPSRHAQIQAARNRARTIRESIDDLYSVAGAETVTEAVAAELLPDVAEVPGEA